MDEIKILQEQITSAPREIRTFLAQGEWANVTQKISERNKFSPDQKTALDNEVIFILVGMDSRENFKENIRTTTGVQEFLAREIEYEIDENIFKKVKSFLPTETEAQPAREISQNKPVIPEIPTQQKVFEPKIETPSIQKTTTVEIPPANLPMVEPGEVSHDTTPKVPEARIMNQESGERDTEVRIKNQEASKAKTNTKSAYEGIDPYREPLD